MEYGIGYGDEIEIAKELELEIDLPGSIVNGFSIYFFSKLLKKLEDLNKSQKVFIKQEGYYDDKVTPIAQLVITQLREQLGGCSLNPERSQKELDETISVYEEFLEIFKKEKKEDE